MTNKGFRSDLAKEMRDKYKEMNKKIEQAEKSSFSDGLKEQMKKEIMENFYKEMEEMKTRPGYEEARKAHLEEIKARIKSKNFGNQEKSYKNDDGSITYIAPNGKKYRIIEDENIDRDEYYNLDDEEYEDDGNNLEDSEISEELHGNPEAILTNLKENYIKTEENAEMMGFTGKKVYITLPAVGNFKGFKFEYFVSNNDISRKDFERISLEKQSYSMKDVGKLLKAMNEYMKAMGLQTDGDMNYENDLRYSFTGIDRCNAGECLKYILDLNHHGYWLSDKDEDGKASDVWNCYGDECSFYRIGRDDEFANLFLRLSD